ncbi:MAG: protein of unknown function YibQ [Enterovirga sp.]|nr:protein of unknown function YibQ [Enterovirga sp.]
MISDELNRPLGVDRDSRPPSGGRRVLPILGVASVAILAGIAGYLQLFGDPHGGIPYAKVEIAARPPRPAETRPDAARAPDEAVPSDLSERTRRNGEEVERVSGVSVVRGGGAGVPEALIVTVPDEVPVARPPAPAPRLVDRTRFGVLPRIGPDGAKPLDVYARPVTTLPGGARPAGRVAIVVGGLGISQSATVEAIAKLPAPVTLAFAPYGSDLERLAGRARSAGHEIMLQVPMEPFDYPDSDPGPHTLTTAAKPAENLEHLHWAMGRLAGYVGLVNYMGGKLTADERALSPVLRDAGARGLGFLDDGSSSRSLVAAFKGETRVARADLVVDTAPRADQIDRALEKLETLARSGTVAVGTASALPLSVDRIARWAQGLEARGILLVPASAALRPGSRENAAR